MTAHPPAFLPASLLNEATEIELTNGAQLFSLGEPVAHIFFVLDGQIAAVRYGHDGGEAVMQRAAAGEFFAQSAITANCYGCSAHAVGSARVLRMPVEGLRLSLAGGGPFALAFVAQLASDLRRQCSRVERLHLKLVRDRVLHYLACEGPMTRPGAKLQDWARELGVEPETLSRVLTEMESSGAVLREARGARGVRLP